MYFDSVAALLDMDGHGIFVWAAYGITLAVIVTLLVLPRRRARQHMQQLAGELKRQQGAATLKEER